VGTTQQSLMSGHVSLNQHSPIGKNFSTGEQKLTTIAENGFLATKEVDQAFGGCVWNTILFKLAFEQI